MDSNLFLEWNLKIVFISLYCNSFVTLYSILCFILVLGSEKCNNVIILENVSKIFITKEMAIKDGLLHVSCGYPSNGEVHEHFLRLLFYLWSIRKSTRT